jgi:hypothetical protein
MQEGDDSQINVEDNIERMVMIISGMVRKTKGIRIFSINCYENKKGGWLR